jgi:hypothetical protein
MKIESSGEADRTFTWNARHEEIRKTDASFRQSEKIFELKLLSAIFFEDDFNRRLVA